MSRAPPNLFPSSLSLPLCPRHNGWVGVVCELSPFGVLDVGFVEFGTEQLSVSHMEEDAGYAAVFPVFGIKGFVADGADFDFFAVFDGEQGDAAVGLTADLTDRLCHGLSKGETAILLI